MYNQQQLDQLSTVKYVCCSLSLIASLFVVICCILIKQLRSIPFRLVAALSSAQVIYCLGEIMLFYQEAINHQSLWSCIERNKRKFTLYFHYFSQLQAFMITFGQFSSIMWTILIAQNTYLTIVKNIEFTNRIILYGIGIGLPLLIAGLPIILGMYGLDLVSCWVTFPHRLYIEISYFFPLFLTLVLNIVFYYKTWKFLSAIFQDDMSGSSKLISYPLIMLGCWIVPVIDIYQCSSGKFNYGLTFSSIIFNGIQGSLYALVFALTPQVYLFFKDLKDEYFRDKSPDPLKVELVEEIKNVRSKSLDLPSYSGRVVPMNLTTSKTLRRESSIIPSSKYPEKKDPKIRSGTMNESSLHDSYDLEGI